LDQYLCKGAKVPNCRPPQKATPYWPSTGGCKLLTCCAPAVRPNCSNGFPRFYYNGPCATYACCKRAPTCPTGYTRKAESGKPCTRYSCQKNKGITCSAATKKTRVRISGKYTDVCCPRRPARSSCNGNLTTNYNSKPCKSYVCCKKRPRCPTGFYAKATRGAVCWTYQCLRSNSCPRADSPACGRGQRPVAQRDAKGCVSYACKTNKID